MFPERSAITLFYSLFKLKPCIGPIFLGGKTAIVTGASSGIGFETAKILAYRGAKVILADKENLEETEELIVTDTQNEDVYAKYLDLESLESVREFAREIKYTEDRLDILINNAGVGGMLHRYTKDLLQVEMQINHFGPFLLTHLLTDLLRKSQPSRIIFLSSVLAYLNNLKVENLNRISDYPVMDFLVYSNSKLCNILAAQGFAERLQGQGVTCNAIHPGFVNTNMYQKMRGEEALASLKKIIYFVLHIVAKTAVQGADAVAHLALSEQLCNVSGKFFMGYEAFVPPKKATDRFFRESIWNASEDYVQLRPYERLRLSPIVKKNSHSMQS
ncbi:hypothetical protein Trydic_g11317 [Trypoxylus dichotomus]